MQPKTNKSKDNGCGTAPGNLVTFKLTLCSHHELGGVLTVLWVVWREAQLYRSCGERHSFMGPVESGTVL
jgi:hypothetical protein